MESELDYEYLVKAAARSIFANTVLTMVAIGVHIFMALYGLAAFFETSKIQRKGRALYIVISFLITTLSALSASLDCFWIFRCLFEATSAMGFYDTTDKYARSWERLASVACFTVVIFIGDGLLVYRCYIIWKHRWYVTVLPAIAYLVSVGLGILSFVPVATGSSHNVNSKHEAAWIFMNVATNVMVTALISFHLLITRSSLSQIIPSKQLTLYHGVVAILIESALPLSVFGVIYASMLVGTVQEETKSLAMFDSARTVLSFLYYAFTAIAPHLIIFRITTNRSWAKAPPRRGTSEDPNTAPLEFDHSTQLTRQSSLRSYPEQYHHHHQAPKRESEGTVVGV